MQKSTSTEPIDFEVAKMFAEICDCNAATLTPEKARLLVPHLPELVARVVVEMDGRPIDVDGRAIRLPADIDRLMLRFSTRSYEHRAAIQGSHPLRRTTWPPA